MNQVLKLAEVTKIRASLPKSTTAVLATGVFDILHNEHAHFLKKARQAGNLLFVGVEPDGRVRQLKGKGRPVNPQEKRAETIARLSTVDYAFILPNNLGTKAGREQLIKSLRPDIYAISANTPFQEEKGRVMRKFSGKLKVVLPYNPKVSTSKLIKAQNHLGRTK